MATLPTYFAPPERADEQVVRTQNARIAGLGLVHLLLDSFPEGAVVLNSQRQIVFANDKVAAFLSKSRETLVGLRLGEALACEHAQELPAGCGTTEACRFCGAAQAVEASRLNLSKEVQECRILRSGNDACVALDLRVWAAPIELEGERFTILAVRDISDEKRRQILERIFFHDVINLAGGLRGALELLPNLSGAEAIKFEHLAASQAEQMIEEIECQRDLGAAESGDLAVHCKPVSIREFLDRICFLYQHHPVGEGKTLTVEAGPADETLETDPILLRRILGNLIKNALEASQRGEAVTVRSASGPHGHVFSVHNSAVLSDAVRAQIFQRSFSTKAGKGRGLGSYSVKLLTERHLHGRVEFDSVEGQGTTFRIVLPELLSEHHQQEIERPVIATIPARDDGSKRSLAGMRILLAEDNIVNQCVAKGMLRKEKVQVHVVSNGKEAVQAVQAQEFDAVLMDTEMPEMNGLEAAASIRALERQRGGHLPIIALTAHTAEENRRNSLAAGMDEHLTKPLAMPELRAALLRSRRARIPQGASSTALTGQLASNPTTSSK